jgi:pyruvate dehydrogenase E2 component (dihydrolipoamide acetyltransferase)
MSPIGPKADITAHPLFCRYRGKSRHRASLPLSKLDLWVHALIALNDHRSVDSALGAQLIGAFKALIENPVMMLV